MSAQLVPVRDQQRTASTSWIDLVQPAADLAQEIAATDFVPQEMRNRPAMIAACILFGAELGLGPMVSLAKIAIVKGRPAPYAELARALALGAGHEIWVDEQTNTRCKVSGRRRGSQQIHTVTWTADDVKKAGITSAMYAKYPRQMLYARASAELVRQLAPDVLGGITVFAEEAGDPELMDNDAAATETPTPVKATTRKRATTHTQPPAKAQEPPPLPGDDFDEVKAEEEREMSDQSPTDAQIKKMMATFNDLGIKERGDRLSFITAAVRPVESSKGLTIEEAGTVIDALDKVTSGELEMVYVDGQIQLTASDTFQPSLPDD